MICSIISFSFYPTHTTCKQVPPMGLYDLLMDATYDDAALFVQTLSNARAALGELFYEGRASRDLNFTLSSSSSSTNTNTNAYDRTVEEVRARRSKPTAVRGLSAFNKKDLVFGLEYDTISTQVWLDGGSSSLTIIGVSNEKNQVGDMIVSFSMNVADYDFVTTSTSIGAYSIDMSDGSETLLQEVDPTNVFLSFSVAPRKVAAIRLKEL
jgi:hypothetical protein